MKTGIYHYVLKRKISMSVISKQVIEFANNQSAILALCPAGTKAADIIQSLEIAPPQAVILSIGSADDLDQALLPRLTQLYGRGIAKAARDAKALILDGGTQAGVMQLMGEAVAAQGYQTTLIGVAPKGMITYPGSEVTSGTQLEPNHSHFVIVEGSEWGSETSTLLNLFSCFSTRNGDTDARTLNDQKHRTQAVSKIPAVAILAGGGSVARVEALRVVRQNIPLIVIEGSGDLADEIAIAYKEKGSEIDDPFMAEVIADGDLHFHLLSNSVKGIERLIVRELGNDKVLFQAWETFANYDLNATRQQKRFDKLQQSLIVLGLCSVALVVLQQVFAPRDAQGDLLPATLNVAGFWWWSVYYLLILIPIVLTILVTAANRFKQGNKWLLLRAGAEAIKREIFRYRTRALTYETNGEQQLAKAMEDITRRTMRTEVNQSALVQYDKQKGFPPYFYIGTGDDGFGYLSPDRYVEVRLIDQLNFFQRKTVRLEKQLRRLYWLTFIIGGIGTFLAAIGMQAWVALTTSLVAAFGTYLGYRQTESTLTKYNQTATDLANVKAWWEALTSEEQAKKINIDSLVNHTEQILQTELDGWVQQMQNALADLRKGQEPSESKPEVTETTITKSLTITQSKNQKLTESEEETEQAQEVPQVKEDRTEPEIESTNGKEAIEPIGRFG
jgi:hypothetical protein